MTGPDESPSTGWTAINEAEKALLLAAAANDRQGYFQVIAVADLYLPQLSGDGDGGGLQRFLTVRAFDHVFVPVFTSMETLAAQAGHAVDGYVVTSYAELRRKWPDPEWRLAINPGTPVDAYLSVDGVEQAATGDEAVPTLIELIAASTEDYLAEQELREVQAAADYPDDPAEALRAAARAGDAYGYAELLLDGTALVLTTRPVPAETMLDDDFPWVLGADRMIEVFTGTGALARTYPAAPPYITAAMPFVLAMLPEGYGLRINPGGDDGIELEAAEIPWLLAFDPSAPPAEKDGPR